MKERHVVAQVFGDRTPEIPISGTKPFTGHPLGATGGMEIAACLLGMEHAWTPPTLHFEQPDEGFESFNFVPNHGQERPLRTVMTNAFGFGGINSCLVLRQV